VILYIGIMTAEKYIKRENGDIVNVAIHAVLSIKGFFQKQ